MLPMTDIAHFAHHDAIEAKEEALARKAQGLPDFDPPAEGVQQVFGDGGGEDGGHGDKDERLAAVRSQAARFAGVQSEAARRGEWGKGGTAFRRPRDQADRLRKNVPYKVRLRSF